MKIASVVVNRNDGYKDFERGLIHFKSMIRAFDEVNYVDWYSKVKVQNNPGQSTIWNSSIPGLQGALIQCIRVKGNLETV